MFAKYGHSADMAGQYFDLFRLVNLTQYREEFLLQDPFTNMV